MTEKRTERGRLEVTFCTTDSYVAVGLAGSYDIEYWTPDEAKERCRLHPGWYMWPVRSSERYGPYDSFAAATTAAEVLDRVEHQVGALRKALIAELVATQLYPPMQA